MKLLSLFTGIGAFEKALKNIGIDYDLVGFSEIDKWAIKSYCAIHEEDENKNLGDITKIDISKLDDDIDMLIYGSPCQSYSCAGTNTGGDEGSGTTSSLMWNTVEIIKKKKPKYVIWENVKNVLSKKHIHNFNKYLDVLKEQGYINHYQVLNSKNFDVPQSRERIFIVSIREDVVGCNDFKFDLGSETKFRLYDILEEEIELNFYVSKEKVRQLLINNSHAFDMSKDCLGTCHIRNDMAFATRDRVYNPYKFSPTLTATDYKDPKKVLDVRACLTPDRVNKRQNGRRFKNNGEPSFTLTSQDRHGVLVLDKEDNNVVIRKLTPKECFRLQAFTDLDFERAASVSSNTQLYRQAGNSITVSVLESIFSNLLK